LARIKTSSLDLLEKTQSPAPQARAILQVMDLEFAAREIAPASKTDLRDLEYRLGDRIHGVELKLEALRGELKSDIQGTVRWNFAFWVVQLAAIAGILKLLK
jgi:hypothetical protein